MQEKTSDGVKDFLRVQAQKIRELEVAAQAAIHQQKDQALYNEIMQKKAQLLAAIADDCAAEGTLSEDDAGRLKRFSASAANALKVGSVFYMSALLYPEDYKEGEKNDLENFIDKLS